MKKTGWAGIVLILLIYGCARQPSVVKLKKGTPSYDTAKEAAMKVPELDPDRNPVIAKSNVFRISAGEVITYLYNVKGKGAAQLPYLTEEQIRENVSLAAQQLAERKLLYRAAFDAGIRVTDAEVDSMLAIQYRHPRFGSREKFESWAEEQGISTDFIRKDFSDMLTIHKGLDKLLGEQVDVTEEDVLDAYNADKTATVRHILFLTQGRSDTEKQEIFERMQGLLERAKGGEDFGRLAGEYSEDPGSKANGGLYEDFERGVMVKPFEDAAFNLPVGEISDIIETTYGYHILKVIGRKKETRPLEEIRETLAREVEAREKQEAYQSFVRKLKEESGFEMTFSMS